MSWVRSAFTTAKAFDMLSLVNHLSLRASVLRHSARRLLSRYQFRTALLSWVRSAFTIAEAFDMWEMQKNANDYHLFFRDWWERDLTAFIERDRNHPSIFCWSIGNEIVERNGLGCGADISYRLAEKLRALDPTRYMMAGIPIPFNGLPDEDMAQSILEFEKEGSIASVQNKSTSFWQRIFLEKTRAFSAPLDIVGYNYLEMRYEGDLEADPCRFICGTETFSEQITAIWPIVERNPRVLGDFVWTSWDYLGEVWIGKCYSEEEVSQMQELYPGRAADCACFDITGCERPALAFHRIAWGSMETYISVREPSLYGKKLPICLLHRREVYVLLLRLLHLRSLTQLLERSPEFVFPMESK